MMYPSTPCKQLLLQLITLGFTLLASAGNAQVTPVTMNSANSTAIVDVGSDAGMYFWSVNGPGGINQLAKQWFYFRIGDRTIAWQVD